MNIENDDEFFFYFRRILFKLLIFSLMYTNIIDDARIRIPADHTVSNKNKNF